MEERYCRSQTLLWRHTPPVPFELQDFYVLGEAPEKEKQIAIKEKSGLEFEILRC